jgi:branched-chain amino acid transport system permease protein
VTGTRPSLEAKEDPTRALPRTRPAWFLAAAVIAGLLPLGLRGDYALHLGVAIGINAIVVLGLNLLMGYAGQVSLGQAAFVGVGAYAAAILGTKLGGHLSPWLNMLAGIALSAAIAASVGIPLLRLRGHYLAMGTLGFGMIVHILMVQWEGLTTGTTGISGFAPLSIAGINLDTETRMYYLVAGIVLLVLAMASNMINSRVGRALRAVHTSEAAAGTSGVDIARYKLQVFVISAALAGLAGGLYAHHAGYVNPDSFGFAYSIQLVVMVVIGGMASIWGAVFGAGAVTLFSEYLRSRQELSPVIFGLVLMAVMVFLPDGLWRGMANLVSRVRRRPGAETEAV